jgi:hypothetical protein
MANLILKSEISSSRSDWVGVCASVLCAVHCAAMPFLISYLPVLGLSFLADELFHKVMVFVCFSIAIYAFVPGFVKHRRWWPALFGLLGLMFISAGAFAIEDNCCDIDPEHSHISSDASAALSCCEEECDDAHSDNSTILISSTTSTSQITTPSEQSPISRLLLWLTPIGGLLLVTGHLLNRKYGCVCDCCPPRE